MSVKQHLAISAGIGKRRKVTIERNRKRKAKHQLGPAKKRLRCLRPFDRVALEAELRHEKDRCEARRTLQAVLSKRTKEEVAARLELIHRSPNTKLLKRKAEHQLGPAKKRLRCLRPFDHVALEAELRHEKDRCEARRTLQAVLSKRTKEEAAAPAHIDEEFVVHNDHMDVVIDQPVLQQAGADTVMNAPAAPVVVAAAAAAVTDISVPAALATVAPVVQPRRRRRAVGPRIHDVS